MLLYECIAGYSPFCDPNGSSQNVICQNIVAGRLRFPKGFDVPTKVPPLPPMQAAESTTLQAMPPVFFFSKLTPSCAPTVSSWLVPGFPQRASGPSVGVPAGHGANRKRRSAGQPLL